MRVIPSTRFYLILALFLLAPLAMAQENTAVVVLGEDRAPLADALVTYRIPENGIVDLAAPLGDGVFEIPVVETKVAIIVEDASFGSRYFEVDLPPDDSGPVVLYIDTDQGYAKAFPFLGVSNLTQVAATGPNPNTPPPGQGCQLPDQLGHGGAGYVAVVSDRTSPFRAADCFKPQNDGNLTHAVWWGAYVSIVFGLGTDCGPGPGDDFQITYYEDDGGKPGAVRAGPFSVGLTEKFQTGNLLMQFADEWQFQSTFHAPVAVTAGECIWIEITNDTSGDEDCFWLWETAPPGDEVSAQTDFDGVTWLCQDFDLAFCVNFQIESGGCGGPTGPPNDDCENCEQIAGEGLFDFDNSSATGSVNLNELLVCGDEIDNDVWYCWQSPCDGTAVLETCGLTSVDTKIAVWEDELMCPPDGLQALSCSDDDCGLQSRVEWPVTAGEVYLIRLGTFVGSSGGTGQFSIECVAPVTNDDCGDAIAVAVPSTTPGTTSGTSSDGAPTCGTTNTAPGVWYSVTGTGNTMTADLCNGNTGYDSKLGVFCGDCADLVCVAGNDDDCGTQSSASWCSELGTEYKILVHGFNASTGNFELVVSDDGSPCGGPVDCSMPLTHDLDVDSTIPHQFVQVNPIDLYHRKAGLAPFSRTYNPLTEVSLAVPELVDGRRLLGWALTDAAGRERILRPVGGELVGVLAADRSVRAVYGQGAETSGGVLRR